MSHYRKVDVRIWNDAKFMRLDTPGKLGFFLLLTHPNMTALGAMRGTPAGLVAELQGAQDDIGDGFRDGFRDIFQQGMAEYDPEGRLIALPNFVKYNPPAAPNSVKSWVSCLEFLPECRLKVVVIQRAVAFAEGMGKGFKDAIPDALRHAIGYTESREQRPYPIQGGGLSELDSDGEEGKRPALAVVNGSGWEDEL
jgi:hypothetical protein